MECMIDQEMAEAAEAVLRRYGFCEPFIVSRVYIGKTDRTDYYKLIFRADLKMGKRLVVKLLNEDEDLTEERQKIENQSAFSELLRKNGISTPKRYMADGRYCNEAICRGRRLNVTVEDWCGEEITEITAGVAERIGGLLARMHTLSLKNGCMIGCGTLFSAAYSNDVDVFERFCELTKDQRLNQEIVDRIRRVREEKLMRIRAVWDMLPRAAVQGDISINNLTGDEQGLTVFDYNNAGDEVLISDLVLEGLLTAYEMELPAGVPEACREELFPALLKGYLSFRKLSAAECEAAWEVYTLYHGLWFSRIVFHENSLEKRMGCGDYETANRLLEQMLADMTEKNDGRFAGNGG